MGTGMTGHFSKYIGIGLAAVFAAGLTPAAWAQDCPPLKKITSIKLEPLGSFKRVLVPVTINNGTKKFLLDTAGISGFITKEASDDLKLPHAAGVGQIKVVKTIGLGGTTYELPATEANDTTLISPKYPVDADRDGNIDGTLTTAFLLNKGELDLDFPGGTLNLFSPDHCPGRVNYWGAPDIGFLPLSYDVIEMSAVAKGTFSPTEVGLTNDIAHLTVPVTLDGHALNAWIDTSAEKSSISVEVAARLFNLQQEDLGPQSEVKVTPETAMGIRFHSPYGPTGKEIVTAKVYRHKFSGLTLGHVDIKNLELLIVPDRWGRNGDRTREMLYTPKRYSRNVWDYDIAAQGDYRGAYTYDVSGRQFAVFSNAKKDVPDMVLGMDVLRHLHMYLALKEKRMYFSVGAAPAPKPPAN
jgi:hypothetical protein